MRKYACIVVFLCLVATALLAQKPFEGRIRYAVEYLSFPEGKEGVEIALPNMVTLYAKAGNYRLEQTSALAGTLVVIMLDDVDSVYRLFQFMGKTAVLAEKVPILPHQFRSIVQDDEKVIAGRTCTRVYRHAADGNHNEAWVDKKIENPLRVELIDLEHLPLQFETVQNGISMRYTALWIGPEAIDETYFMLPTNAVRITEAVLHKLVK